MMAWPYRFDPRIEQVLYAAGWWYDRRVDMDDLVRELERTFGHYMSPEAIEILESFGNLVIARSGLAGPGAEGIGYCFRIEFGFSELRSACERADFEFDDEFRALERELCTRLSPIGRMDSFFDVYIGANGLVYADGGNFIIEYSGGLTGFLENLVFGQGETRRLSPG
jgi:hypothetical protein